MKSSPNYNLLHKRSTYLLILTRHNYYCFLLLLFCFLISDHFIQKPCYIRIIYNSKTILRARMFICKYMYFPTWVFCFVFCGNLQRLLYNMSKQGCFFNKFSHHRECNEYSEIWSYYKEKGNTNIVFVN
jgi:hypothetical protein